MNPATIKEFQPEHEDGLRWYHTFVVCTGRLDGSHTCQCFIDPNFKDQFLIGKPTETYQLLLEILPNVFIGTPLRLQSLIDFVYLEIAQAYCQQQLPVPPWRSHRVLLGRWFSTSPVLVSVADNKADQKSTFRRGLATIDEKWRVVELIMQTWCIAYVLLCNVTDCFLKNVCVSYNRMLLKKKS